jgi:hypothetical protein
MTQEQLRMQMLAYLLKANKRLEEWGGGTEVKRRCKSKPKMQNTMNAIDYL